MNNVYKLIMIILSLSIICCFNQPPFTEKKKKKITISEYVNFCMIFTSTSTWNEVEDNRDGTISLVTRTSSTRYNPICAPFAGSGTRKVDYIVKKCIQGQVYRSAENDCKGTGTAANYYGAQKLQWCSTHVSNTFCAPSVSPVKLSCKNELLGNRLWEPKNFKDFDSYQSIKDYYKSRTSEIPSTTADFYWSKNASLADINARYIYADNLFLEVQLDSFNYVLCASV